MLRTLAEAAEILGLSVNTVRHQREYGRIAAAKYGRDWLIEDREIERYRRESLGRPGAPRRKA